MGENLLNILSSMTIKDEPMSRKTTFGIGAKPTRYIEPKTNKELVKAINICRRLGLKYKVIGNGSNLLFSSKSIDLVIISTRSIKEKFSLHQNSLKVSSGTMASELILWCAQRGLSGLENLFSIPATIGGMVINNAGAFGSQMSDVVLSVEVYDEGKIRIIPASEIEFEYHNSSLKKTQFVVLNVEISVKRLAPSVIYSIIKERIEDRKSQPSGMSAGSVFKKCGSIPAGKLIDECSLKGTRCGRAKISEKHANFIINEGGATSNDVLRLIEIAKSKVKEKFGVELEEEIEYIGE